MRTLLSAFVLLVPSIALAQYQLMESLGPLSGTVNLTDYVQGVFRVIIGLAGVLAVVMIVWCGIKIMGTPSASAKSEAKKCITNAIFGVLLAAGSWIILNTINTQLLSNDFNMGATALQPVTVPGTPGTPITTFVWSSAPGVCPRIVGKVVTVAPPSSCTGAPPIVGAVCCSLLDVPYSPPPGAPGFPPIPPAPPAPPPGPPPVFPPPPRPTPPPAPPTPPPAPPASTGDSISPTVAITRPGSSDYTVTTGSLVLGYDVTENTALSSITIEILNGVGTVISTQTICSAATPLCPSLGQVGSATFDLSTAASGNYTISLNACDASRNCATTTTDFNVLAGCTATNPACKTDYNALAYCIGQRIAGSCARADLDRDGLIDINDLYILLGASNYDIDKNGIIDPTTTATNFDNTCFFYTAQDPLLPCAARVLGDITITTADKANFEAMFAASKPSATQVNLATLDVNLCRAFPCTGPGMGLGGTDQLSVYGEAMFSTLSTYDFNADGIVDWGIGSPDMIYFSNCLNTPTAATCKKADVNRDNYITPSDLNMIKNLEIAWSGVGSLLSDMERTFWNGTFQPEAGVLTQCGRAILPLTLTCRLADYNASGQVDSADMTFLQGSLRFDINGDGLIIYTNNPVVPILITASTPTTPSTTFRINDRIETIANVIVRSVAGNAQPFVGTVLSGGQGAVAGGPVFVDSNWWWRVNFDSGVVGWATEPMLRLASSPPPPPPPPPSGVSTKFKTGEVVGATANLTVRATASPSGVFVGLIPPNTTQGTIIGAPVYSGGYWWWQVNWTSGITGWSAEDWMKEFTPPPAPAITAPAANSYSTTNTVTIRGTMPAAEVGGTVRVWRGTTVIGSAAIDTAGGWQFTTTLPDAVYTIAAVATDQSQNVGPTSTNRTFTVDTIPPLLPTIVSPLTGSTVRTSTFTINGSSAESGNNLYVYANTTSGTLLGTPVASGSGTWSLTLNNYVDGPYTFAIVERDRAGNISPVRTISVTVDAPPPAPAITLPTNGTAVNLSSITVSGTGVTAGDTIKVYSGATVLGTAIVSGGVWSLPLTGLLDGTYTIRATETDPGLNESTPSANRSFTVDTVAPAMPTITAPVNGYASPIGSTTMATAGTGETMNDLILLYVHSTLLGTDILAGSVSVGSGLTWNFISGLPPSGSYALLATETDRAGNISATSTPISFSVP